MSRVTSALWVAAYVRRVNSTGDAFAVVARRGAEEAGTILIRVDRLDGTSDLYVPAPMTAYETSRPDERRFMRRNPSAAADQAQIDAIVAGEVARDPDVWVVAIDDRAGRSFLGDLLET